MMHLDLAKKNRYTNPDAWQKAYEQNVNNKIRDRYSLDQEIAIIRQRDTKPYEFAEYNAYVEQCKAEAKYEMNI